MSYLIVRGDSKKSPIQDNSVHTIITSPPYNADKEYEEDMDWEGWFRIISEFLKESERVLVNGGWLCVNIPFWMFSRPRKFVPAEFIRWGGLHGFTFTDWISWVKGGDYPEANTTAWGNPCTTPAIRAASEPVLIFRKPGKRIRDTGCTMKEWAELTIGVWNIQPVYDPKHPAAFPLELAKRLVKLYSGPGEVVLDPFSGSGTTTLAAHLLGRLGIGIELRPDYTLNSINRLRTLDIDGGIKSKLVNSNVSDLPMFDHSTDKTL
jgi:DNA modification methylase